MYPFDCYIFKEAIDNKTGFIRSQPQGYSKLTDNLKRKGNLISKYKRESKIGPKQTYQIAKPHQGVKYSLKFVMLRGTEGKKNW